MCFIYMSTVRLGSFSPETNSLFVWGMVRAVSYYYWSVYLQRVDVTREQLLLYGLS
jgi:hypothetical protein